MATFAPPARKGDFLFSSVLYADAGNSNHHSRASIAELAALLRPEAPNLYSKGKKPDLATTPAKDPAWHYYSAQLIHYGLPVTKDKNAAKVRLLNAMNQFKLEVPPWVLSLESDLKKEWEAENRKLKKGAGVDKAQSSKPVTNKSAAAPKAVGAKAATAKATPSKVAAVKAATPKAAVGKGAKSTVAKAGVSQTQSANNHVNVTVNFALPPGLEHLAQQPKKPAAGKRKRDDKDGDDAPDDTPKKAARVKKDPVSKKEPPVKKTPAPKKESSTTKKEPTIKKDPIVKKPPAVKKEPTIKKAPTPKNPIKSENTNDHLLLTGNYSISCPIAESLLMAENLDLSLALDTFRHIWWATFRWGTWDAIVQMNPGPTSTSMFGQSHTLGWRLRDLHTGALEFGRRCTGDIVFLRDGSFRARLIGWPEVGVVEFEGRREEGPVLEDDLRGEWEEFVKEAYGR
ncbi:hypothetical protein NX059_002116 [Plenodomus lindquistii]|nr:hypothetical protein NX059_002116 [Plenodomus lindquistii]